MRDHGIDRDSRAGKVAVAPGVFVTDYHLPRERVMFWSERDCNPFFHLMEGLWMIAGREDVEWISHYSSGIAQFSDDGTVFNGAYGYRWRHYFNEDQIRIIVGNLRGNPDCRRQVMTMWSVDDLVNQNTKDVPCNTQIYFQINHAGRLDMTVCNRSNDLIWGAYGANAVHFSMILEYMAMMINVPMGNYVQFSANTHVYERHFQLVTDMAGQAADVMAHPLTSCPYSRGEVEPFAMGDYFHYDLTEFFYGNEAMIRGGFFRNIVLPMKKAWDEYKSGEKLRAIATLQTMPEKNDWKRAATEWLERRL